MIGVYTGTGNEAGQIGPVIAAEMAALAEGATEVEIARAKAQLKSGLLMGLERPMTRAEQIAGQMFSYGRILSIEELTAKLDEVDTTAVRRFGTRLMNSVRPAVAALGPVAKRKIRNIRRTLWRIRNTCARQMNSGQWHSCAGL